MKLSSMAQKIEPSLARRIFNEAHSYMNVIDFTLGDPDYQTPDYIKQAGCNAILSGKTHYSQNAGLLELRVRLAEQLERQYSVKYSAESEIIVSVGAMEGLYLSLLCILNPGDEVIIPAPYWLNYCHMVQMCGGVPIIIDSLATNNFALDVDKIESSITDKTVAIIVNSPNNPTGVVYDFEQVKKLAEVVNNKNLFIIWDETYKSIVFEKKYTSILNFLGMKDNTVFVDSFSKKFSMTGWRIGYVAGHSELIKNMTKLQENIAACAPLPSQHAAIEALKIEKNVISEFTEGFRHRRDILVSQINLIDKLNCKLPEGTFYAFVNIEKTGLRSEEFALRLLREKQIAVVPGIAYGACADGYIRIAYTLNEDKIKEGVGRIADFVASL